MVAHVFLSSIREFFDSKVDIKESRTSFDLNRDGMLRLRVDCGNPCLPDESIVFLRTWTDQLGFLQPTNRVCWRCSALEKGGEVDYDDRSMFVIEQPERVQSFD